jgi:hypothetical protein
MNMGGLIDQGSCVASGSNHVDVSFAIAPLLVTHFEILIIPASPNVQTEPRLLNPNIINHGHYNSSLSRYNKYPRSQCAHSNPNWNTSPSEHTLQNPNQPPFYFSPSSPKSSHHLSPSLSPAKYNLPLRKPLSSPIFLPSILKNVM